MTRLFIKSYALFLSLLHTIFCVAYLNASQPERKTCLLSASATQVYNYHSGFSPKYKDLHGSKSDRGICLPKIYGNWAALSSAEDEIKNYYQWQLKEAIDGNTVDDTLNMIVEHMSDRYLFDRLGFISMYGDTDAARRVWFEKARLFFLSTVFMKTKACQNASVTDAILQKIAKMQTDIIETVIPDVTIQEQARLEIASLALNLAIVTDTPKVMESLVSGIIKTVNEQCKDSSKESKTLEEANNNVLAKRGIINCTPKKLLETAIKNGKTDAIEWLLKNDSTKKIVSYKEPWLCAVKSPWQHALETKNPKIIQLCLDNGASITSDCITINIPKSDETGDVKVDVSPLAYALHIKDESLSNFLITNGAIIGEREKEVAHKTGVQALINLVTPKSVDIVPENSPEESLHGQGIETKDSPEDSPKDNFHGQKIEKTEGTETQSISQTPDAQQQGIRPIITAPSLFVTQNFLKSALVVGGMVSGVALIMYTIKALQKASQEQKTSQKNDSHKETESYDPAILI